MAAPTQGPYATTATIYDPTGADVNPIADGWTIDFTGTSHSNWKRLSNVMAPSNEGAPAQAYRGSDTYGFDHEIWTVLPAKGATDGHYVDIVTMLTDPNLTTRDFYGLELTVAAGADAWDLFRQFNSTGAFPLTGGSGTPTATQEFAAGDYIALSVRDNGSGSPRIKGWYWALAGSSWAEIVTYDDTSASKIVTAGFMGLEATQASAWRVGVIKGGPIGAAPPPPTTGAPNMLLMGVG